MTGLNNLPNETHTVGTVLFPPERYIYIASSDMLELENAPKDSSIDVLHAKIRPTCSLDDSPTLTLYFRYTVSLRSYDLFSESSCENYLVLISWHDGNLRSYQMDGAPRKLFSEVDVTLVSVPQFFEF